MTTLVEPAPTSPAAGAAGALTREAQAGATLSVGMAVALAAVLMTFAAVLLAYAVLRVQAASWPPPGESPPPPLWPWPLLATAVALTGSAAMLRAQRQQADLRADAAASRSAPRMLLVAAGAGLAFLVIQGAAWTWLARSGVRPDGGLVASVVYALTVFHALHAGAAVVVLAPLVVRRWRGRRVRPSALRAVAAFWHLVTVLWLVVFVTVFVT